MTAKTITKQHHHLVVVRISAVQRVFGESSGTVAHADAVVFSSDLEQDGSGTSGSKAKDSSWDLGVGVTAR